MIHFNSGIFFSRFLTSPKKLFWFYIFMNLIPSICLMFTEPFTFSGKIALLTFPAGLYLILFSLKTNTGAMQLLLFPLL
ncbi:MAG: sulfatase, partial [Odoribacter sp.]|nr:sulfatase [Odoribacter sp.]